MELFKEVADEFFEAQLHYENYCLGVKRNLKEVTEYFKKAAEMLLVYISLVVLTKKILY